jgi:hypothetical protein
MLAGGGEPADPQYRMNLRVTSSETALGITREGTAPVYSVTVTASYTLYRIGSDEIVLRETTRGTASYDRYEQNFSNIRALRDAENRAAEVAADEIRLRVATATAVPPHSAHSRAKRESRAKRTDVGCRPWVPALCGDERVCWTAIRLVRLI